MLGMGFTQLEPDWPAVDYVRIWDIGCDWARINTARNVYEWSRLDAVVAKAESIGARVCYVHHGVPQWLAKNPVNEHTAPWMPPGSNSVPKDLDAWNEWVWHVATRYHGRIHSYEIGNELQLPDFLYPWDQSTRNTWAKMHKRAYNTIKAVDPDALVGTASILPRKSSGGVKKGGKYLDEIAKVAGKTKKGNQKAWPADFVACHIYPTVGENYPEWRDYYKEVKKASKDRGGPGKVWVTETAWDLLGPATDDAKGQNMMRKVREKHSGYVFWYAYDRPDLGGTGGLMKEGTLTWSELEKFRA